MRQPTPSRANARCPLCDRPVVAGPTTYTVVFGGSLAGFNLAQMTATGVNGTNVSVITRSDGDIVDFRDLDLDNDR